MEKEYIISTNYFNQRWTWILRALRFLIATLFLYLIDLQELENGSSILLGGYIFAALLGTLLIVWPTDELAVDNVNIYLFRKSVLPLFNRSIEYKISNLKGIGSYNMSKPAGIFALFVPVWDVHRIEIIFKDDSSLSHDLLVPKKDLKKILLMVRKKILQSS